MTPQLVLLPHLLNSFGSFHSPGDFRLPLSSARAAEWSVLVGRNFGGAFRHTSPGNFPSASLTPLTRRDAVLLAPGESGTKCYLGAWAITTAVTSGLSLVDSSENSTNLGLAAPPCERGVTCSCSVHPFCPTQGAEFVPCGWYPLLANSAVRAWSGSSNRVKVGTP